MVCFPGYADPDLHPGPVPLATIRVFGPMTSQAQVFPGGLPRLIIQIIVGL